jgi:hypothetical protein
MKRSILLSALSLAALAAFTGAVRAGEVRDAGLCKPLCASDQRACRSNAASLSDQETLPLLAMPETNEHARVSQKMSGKATVAQTKQGYESRRVQLQRTCDSQYLRCVQGCGQQGAGPAGKTGQAAGASQ